MTTRFGRCPGCLAPTAAGAGCCLGCGRCPGCGVQRARLGNDPACAACSLPNCAGCGRCPARGKPLHREVMETCSCGYPKGSERVEELLEKFHVE